MTMTEEIAEHSSYRLTDSSTDDSGREREENERAPVNLDDASIIECQECESDQARNVQVTYTTGSAEMLGLCDRCAAEFENGGFVTEVFQTEFSE